MERKVLLDVEIQTSEAVKASAALQVQIDGLRKSQNIIVGTGGLYAQTSNSTLVANNSTYTYPVDGWYWFYEHPNTIIEE